MNNIVSENVTEKKELSLEQLEEVSGGISFFGETPSDGAKSGFVGALLKAGCKLVHWAGCDLVHLAGCDLVHLAEC